MEKRNMKQWLKEQLDAKQKTAMPVLSFPAIQLLNISVKDLISSSDAQANGMKAVADRVDSAASVSLMDLSVEAECFGSQIRFSDGEVPTVVGSVVSDLEAAEKLEIPAVGAGRTVFAGVIGPFSLAGRLMDVSEAMIYCYEEPEMVHMVMDKVSNFIIDYINAYKKLVRTASLWRNH